MARSEGCLALALALSWAVAACAGQAAPQAAEPEADPTLARAEAVGAAERAPDLWVRANEAAEQARAASSAEAALDYTTEARLWRQSAIAEAERQRALEQRGEVEQRNAARAQQLATLQAERDAVREEARRLAAGRLALEEVARVLALAAEEPRRRPTLDEAALRRGTRALLDRALLVSAAARRLGAAATTLDGVDARLKRAEAMLEKQPQKALHEADEALFDAQAALGPVRGARVDAATQQSLVDALAAAGFDPRRGDRGLTATLTTASPGGVLPARSLGRLCKLRQAFPAGEWQLALRDPRPAQARRRVAPLRRQLGALGCAAAPIDIAGAAGLKQSVLEVSFLAY